jgi:hypothetical protein
MREPEAKSRWWSSLFYKQQTLSSGATDAALSVCRLTLAMACYGGATDAVVAVRQTHNVSVRRQWRQPGVGASTGELCVTDTGRVLCWHVGRIC